MISRLNSIDWKGLNAEDLPSWVIGLLSDNHEERFTAFRNFTKFFHLNDDQLNTFHGFITRLSTDIPILITPFLVEIAINGNTKDKDRVIEILALLAIYKNTPNLSEKQRYRAEKVYDQIFANFDIYIQFLKNDDPNLRLSTILLLDCFEKPITTLLLSHIEVEGIDVNAPEAGVFEDEKMNCAAIIFADIEQNFFLNSEHVTRFKGVLKRWLTNYADTLLIHSLAAYYLIRIDGENSDWNIIQTLANTLKVPTHNFFNIPDLDNCIDIFWGLGVDIGSPLLLEIFREHTVDRIILDLASALLSLHFGDGDFREIYSMKNDPYRDRLDVKWDVGAILKSSDNLLSTRQKEVLHTLVEKKELWDIQVSLFYLFGLPDDPNELRSLLNQYTS